VPFIFLGNRGQNMKINTNEMGDEAFNEWNYYQEFI